MTANLTKSLRERAESETRGMAEDLVGVQGWRRSKLGWLIGADVPGQLLGGIVHGFGSSWRRTANLAQLAILRRDRVMPLPTYDSDPDHRFQIAARVYGRSAADLDADIKGLARRFTLYFVMAVLVLAAFIASLPHAIPSLPRAVDIACRFMVPLMAFAVTARVSFYSWQMRTRRLGSVREWLRSGDWFPPGAGTGLAAFLGAVATGLLAFGIPGAQDATAAGTSGFSGLPALPTTDLWVRLLEYVFPGIGPIGNGPATGGSLTAAAGIQGAFGAFLAVLMAIAAGLMSWHVLLGMVNTAHEGKVLGQRWHQIWAPIRVSIGIGMLAPVFKGYCTAQLLALFISVAGGQLGNVIWGGYVDAVTTNDIAAPRLPETLPLFRDLIALEACHATITLSAELHSKLVVSAATTKPPSVSELVGPWPERWVPDEDSLFKSTVNGAAGLFGARPVLRERDHRLSYGRCGSITLTAVEREAVTGDAALTAKAAFDEVRLEAIQVARVALRELAARMASGIPPGVKTVLPMPRFSELLAVRDAYDRKMAAAAETYLAAVNGIGLEQIRADLKAGGWASAGTYYVTISRVHEMIARTAGERPNVKIGSDADWTAVPTEVRRLLVDGTTGVFPMLAQWWSLGLEGPGVSRAAAAAGKITPSGSTVDEVLNYALGGDAIKSAIEMLSPDLSKGNALSHIIAFGHALLTAFWIGLGILAAANAGIGIATVLGAAAGFLGGSAVPGAGNATGGLLGAALAGAASKVISGISGFLTSALIVLLIVGAVHAFVLPLIPYVMHFFFVAGMLILTVEAVIAAPLWAFFHIRMDGQDFVDQVQRPGYMIMFNLLLRIPLAMFGLFFSYLVFDALAWFIHQTFIAAAVAVTSTQGYGIIGLMTLMVMVAYLHYQAAIRSFGLITQVPDRVSRWFGQGGEQLGEAEDSRKTAGFLIANLEQRGAGVAETAIGAALARRSSSGGQDEETSAGPSGGQRRQDSQPRPANAKSGISKIGGGVQ
ncbi:DotA/TraY family protein [Azospirillum sp. HJ39]|uniref:DotA/TraY family protein n=1 Tax=Azospirillum sp. HJ39 TaxID=3159496 RepID=UPI003558AE47